MSVENPPETAATTSLSAVHWALFTIILLLIMAACAYGGFLAGQRLSQAEQQSANNDLNTQLAQLKYELGIAQQKLQLIASSSKPAPLPPSPPIDTAAAEAIVLGDNQAPANCAQVEQKIRQLEKQMNNTGSAIVYDSNEQWQEQQQQRHESLSQQLAHYQQRLVNCE